MTDNEKLARWQGWTHDEVNLLKHFMSWIEPDGVTRHDIYSDYINDDAAAMSLLDTLVDKNYHPELFYCLGRKWNCTIACDGDIIADSKSNTRREAVVVACLELLKKEEKDNG